MRCYSARAWAMLAVRVGMRTSFAPRLSCRLLLFAASLDDFARRMLADLGQAGVRNDDPHKVAVGRRRSQPRGSRRVPTRRSRGSWIAQQALPREACEDALPVARCDSGGAGQGGINSLVVRENPATRS